MTAEFFIFLRPRRKKMKTQQNIADAARTPRLHAEVMERAATAAESNPSPAVYHALLLRCWRDPHGWRFVLEAADTRTVQGFADVAALTEFLHQHFALPEPGSGVLRQAAVAHKGAVEQPDERQKQ